MQNVIASSIDIEINAVTLVAAGYGAFSLNAGGIKWTNITIYEDILVKGTTGTIQIDDGTDIISLLELHGNEYLYISFNRPSETEEFKKVTRSFRIVKATDRKPKLGSQGQTYVLHFCSEELVFSNMQTISRSFKGETATKHIYNICKNTLKVSDNRLKTSNFEDSYGIIDMALTSCKPYEAIDIFTSKAFSQNESTFIFFENREGYNFYSLEGLFKRPTVAKLKYSTVKLTDDNLKSPFTSTNDISKFNHSTFDIYEKTRHSTYAGSLYTLDLIRQKYTRNLYTAINASDKVYIEGNIPVNFARNRNEKTLYDEYGAGVKYTLTNYNQTYAPYLAERGYRVNNVNVEKTVLQRESQLQLLKSATVKMTVPANPLLSVGYTVDFEMPAFTINKETSRNFDPFYSGKYLISQVRHVITSDGKMQTSLELCKNSPAIFYTFAMTSNKKDSAYVVYKKARDL